jgi:hypothetical protein
MTPDSSAQLRVLAVAEDLGGLVTACRVHAPLHTLRRLGVVSDYVITDSRLTDLPPEFRFDVLWVQRAPEPRLALRIAERLTGRYLHDMDDLLITEPGYVHAGEFPDRDSLVALIREAGVFTAPSRRLASLVEEHSGVSLAERMVVCPNALEFPRQPPRAPERPRGLLLTQSHRLALTDSREAVLGAVRDFAAHEGLPVYYFGPPLEVLGAGVCDLLGPVVECGYLNFWRYHAILAAWPSLLGVAPLETRGDPATLAFVAAKSDVKMVEYGGFGHPAVYSSAAPYVDTDLRAGVVAENEGDAWTDALGHVLEDDWRRLGDDQERVVTARSLERIASECWAAALERARLPEAMAASELAGSRRHTFLRRRSQH